MQVAKEKVVRIHYTLTDEQGDLLDSSEGHEPLTYLHGAGTIVPGLESALEGKAAGDKLTVTVPPEEGYGSRDDELIQAVPRDRFPAEDLEVGMRFHARGEDDSRIVTITAIDDQNVTVDANHPLAGVTLAFDVTVVEVRDATAEELHHGHVHGEGGAHDH
jgi:FKBP-type peptidyl-prolyl cis-trans isomerase SlyD